MDIICAMAREWATQTEDALASLGYRRSASRRTVLELLASESCCVSAPHLHEAARKAGRPVGLASVYRVLDLLTARGFVQKLDLGGDHAQYERNEDAGHHHHLVCNGCGTVQAFADESLESALRRVESETGFEVERHDVLLRGACDDCRA
jgi:Fur family transcriptional regulator, ferric uptake regulator